MTNTESKEILNKLIAMEKVQTQQYEMLTARLINSTLIYDQRFGLIEERLTNLSRRLDAVETKLSDIEKGVGEIDKRTVFFPKLYDNVDKLIGEIIENRQERVIMSSRIGNHESRITKLEKR